MMTVLASRVLDIASDNRWQLKMKREVHGIRIDVAWETYEGLEQQLQGDGPVNCWPFSDGKILRDPSGVVESCLTIARRWFDQHADIRERIEAEYLKAKQKQIRERDGR